MPTKHKVTIELTDAIFKLLKQAANRRVKHHDLRMREEELAMQIIGGVVTKLSIDRAFSFGDF